MRKLKGMSAALCGVLAAAMITVSISAPASAAPKKYVTEISSVKVDGRTVKKNATYKMYIGDTAKIKAAVKVKGKATKIASCSIKERFSLRPEV